MKVVRDVVFRNNGIVVYFTDDTISEGTYKTVNGRLRLIGIGGEERAALQTFYLNRHVSADADLRFFGLDQPEGGTPGGPGSPGAPGTPGAGATATFDCAASVSANDAVSIVSSGTVEEASAESGAGQTGDAIGFVLSKPTSTTCIVQFVGLLDGFSGLTVGNNYWLSQTLIGTITSTAPSSSGEKIQSLGIASSATELVIIVSQGIDIA